MCQIRASDVSCILMFASHQRSRHFTLTAQYWLDPGNDFEIELRKQNWLFSN